MDNNNNPVMDSKVRKVAAMASRTPVMDSRAQAMDSKTIAVDMANRVEAVAMDSRAVGAMVSRVVDTPSLISLEGMASQVMEAAAVEAVVVEALTTPVEEVVSEEEEDLEAEAGEVSTNQVVIDLAVEMESPSSKPSKTLCL
jgi:hypothetical protein